MVCENVKRKDYEPIAFHWFQSDVEKALFFLNEAIIISGQSRPDVAKALQDFKGDWDRKIRIHRHRGEWL